MYDGQTKPLKNTATATAQHFESRQVKDTA